VGGGLCFTDPLKAQTNARGNAKAARTLGDGTLRQTYIATKPLTFVVNKQKPTNYRNVV
jgi:hypothetical protein